MIFNQSDYSIRCEWGEKGVQVLAPISDVIIIIDVLSFTTAVDMATAQGAWVYPYRWRDSSVHRFANSVAAEVADADNKNGYCLSPASLQSLPAELRLVLPSPNGSTLSVATGSTPTIAGCLRNCEAVAKSAMRKGKNIAVVPAGEKWEDGTLRPSLEDLLGAGAIIHHLQGSLSPEARAAAAVYQAAQSDIFERLRGCSSGKEKISKSEEEDLVLAAEVNVSDCVPELVDGAYRKEG
jgi:2-phosphosulfolactate phosphatase